MTKFRYLDRYLLPLFPPIFFVSENRISVQMGSSPILPEILFSNAKKYQWDGLDFAACEQTLVIYINLPVQRGNPNLTCRDENKYWYYFWRFNLSIRACDVKIKLSDIKIRSSLMSHRWLGPKRILCFPVDTVSTSMSTLMPRLKCWEIIKVRLHYTWSMINLKC